MEKTEIATFTNMCMIYDSQGNVLVQNRTDPHWPGITFPGGHVEKGESFTDSVIREVFEETGLTISQLQLCGIKDWTTVDGVRYIVYLYKTNCFQGTLTSSAEGEVRWVSLKELPTLPLASSMDSTLKIFLNDQLTELFFHDEHGHWVESFK